jgi:hypothetical protein
MEKIYGGDPVVQYYYILILKGNPYEVTVQKED